MFAKTINPTVYRNHPIDIFGCKRNLPICKVNDDLYIAAFVIFGDVELTRTCAQELVKKLPPFDIIITVESKGIPLAYEMARILNSEKYLIARKSSKLYMQNPYSVEVQSITTPKKQMLYIDESDKNAMCGKRVVILDDVISTGESLLAVEKLVTSSGGNIVARMCAIAEGDAADRNDIIFLKKIPLFFAEKQTADS